MSVLATRLLAIHDALDQAKVAHAFGGAIALAYCTEEPRGTRDIDVNLFVDPSDAARVIGALPPEVVKTESDIEHVLRDGQARLWWDDTPVDVFFDVHDFHREAPLHVRIVPFSGRHIPILGCGDLAVFKVMFDRTKDWADLEAMVDAGTVDATSTLGWVARLLGPDHPSVSRLASLLRR